MFTGQILGVDYVTWKGYKEAWNTAVKEGKLRDKNGNKITKIYK